MILVRSWSSSLRRFLLACHKSSRLFLVKYSLIKTLVGQGPIWKNIGVYHVFTHKPRISLRFAFFFYFLSTSEVIVIYFY